MKGAGIRLALGGKRRDPKKSLSDSTSSRTMWDLNNIGGSSDSFPQIAGATSKSQDTTTVVVNEDIDRSMIGKIGHGIRSMWHTRYTDEDEDSAGMIKTTLRELIIYVIFVILLCIVTFGMASANMFYLTNLMNNLFINSQPNPSIVMFTTMASQPDLWSFMLQGALLSTLYPNTWYNNQNFTPSEFGYVNNENRLLGAARLRQLRVRNNSCVIPDNFAGLIDSCYDAYSSSSEDKQPFGLKNGSAWTYEQDPALVSLGSGYSGLVSSYGNGGYMQILPNSFSEATQVVTDLMNNLWLDRGTRAVFIDFTMYNANINLFCVMRLVVEFPAAGGIVHSYNIRTVKLIRYVTPGDFFVLACEVFVVLFLIYYTIEEIIEIRKHRLRYLKSFWNILDLVMLIIAYCCMVFNIYRTASVNNTLDKLLKDPDTYPDFTSLSYWQIVFNSSLALLVFCAWVKIFKYISFNKTMTQLSTTLSKCGKDLTGFAIMFFIFFLAFTQLGYLLFGSQVQDYSTMTQAFFSLFRTILGDFNFPELQQASSILGPMFFITYVFFVFFILLNMFLAIINDTYGEVKQDLAEQQNEFEMGEYFKKGAFKVMERMHIKKEKMTDISGALGDLNNAEGVLDFEEWRQHMKQRGYAEAEIEALFAKYDVNGDRVLDHEERMKMQADLANHDEGQRHDSEHKEGGIMSSEELTTLTDRVVGVEQSVGGVLSKVENVLSKIELNEKYQAKRREALTRLLNPLIQTGVMPDDQSRQELIRLVRDEILKDR